MSQFDFPRINFAGKCVMDPSTGNNSWYLPLVIFDPITVSHFIPPRLYLQSEYFADDTTLEIIRNILPEGAQIKVDDTTRFKGNQYVEISPVKDVESFKEWARVPLGEHEIDKAYWGLYPLMNSPNNRTTLEGCVPGYWNYYGTMSYQYQDVLVKSVSLGFDGKKENLINQESEGLSKEIKSFLGAKLTMNYRLNDDSTNSCVMVDHLPTMAMYSQIFTDRLTLYKGRKILLRGKPVKASLRQVNAFRIVNQNMPFAGSGIFYSVIPLDNLNSERSNPIIKIFEKYRKNEKILNGIFIRQVISQVEEDRDIDYRKKGNIPNPAYGILSGSISPWYEGEMKSWPGGRQLIGDAPYIYGRSKGFDAPISLLSPSSFIVNKDEGYAQFDLLNNLPLTNINKENRNEPIEPLPRDNNEYSLYPIGNLDFVLEPPASKGDGQDAIPLGSIEIPGPDYDIMQMYSSSGMHFFPLTNKQLKLFGKWNVAVYGSDTNGNKVRVWKESPIIITSDEAGLYANQGDDPSKGYTVNTSEKEYCTLRIFDRGQALSEEIDITIVEYKVDVSGSSKAVKILRNAKYRDGDVVAFSTNEPLNAIYLFLPIKTSQLPKHGYPGSVVETGFFVNLKVLPGHHFGKYLDRTHPDFPTKVTFDVLFENVFKTFALLSPTMTFHKERFENASMASVLLNMTALENWDAAWYMPASRDLSKDQIELIKKWATSLLEEEKDENGRMESWEHDSSSSYMHKHLSHRNFFNK